MKIRELPRRYLLIQSLIWIILVIFSIIIGIIGHTDWKPVWFFLVLPIAWFFSYGFLSQRFHIFYRSFLRIILLSIIILLIMLVPFGYTLGITRSYDLIILSLFWALIPGLFALLIGYGFSFIKAEYVVPNEDEINRNSLTFELTKNETDNVAIREVFLKLIHKHLNFWKGRNLRGNSTYYVTFPVKYELIVTWNSHKIAFFPFISDSSFFAPTPSILIKIKIIGEKMLNLKSNVSGELLIKDFLEYAKPHYLLRGLKAIRRELNARDIRNLLVLIGLFVIIALYLVNPNIIVNVDLLSATIWITGTLIFSIIGSLIGTKIMNFRSKRK